MMKTLDLGKVMSVTPALRGIREISFAPGGQDYVNPYREPLQVDPILKFSIAKNLYEQLHNRNGLGRSFEMLTVPERQLFLDSVQVVLQALCDKGFSVQY